MCARFRKKDHPPALELIFLFKVIMVEPKYKFHNFQRGPHVSLSTKPGAKGIVYIYNKAKMIFMARNALEAT